MTKFKKCHTSLNACIEGESIYIECRKPGKWGLFRMTGQHRGSQCIAKKNARAIILRERTNTKKKPERDKKKGGKVM